MKRQMDLAAQLLLMIESNDAEGAGLYRSEILSLLKANTDASDAEKLDHWNTIDYHLRLLSTAGFIRFTPSDDGDGTPSDNFELTWSGHDYLDQNRPSQATGFFSVGWIS